MKKIILIIVIILLLTGSLLGWYFSAGKNDATGYITSPATVGNIRTTISATGSLAALTTVEIGSQISGNILKLYADFNDRVSAGQLLAQLDPATYEAQVEQAKANLENAIASFKSSLAQQKNLEASMITAKAEIEVSRANITKAQVMVDDALRKYNRTKELFERKLVSAADRDQDLTNLDSQKASLEASKAQYESAKARVMAVKAQMEGEKAQRDGTEARIRQMEAQLNIARINLERTKIYSPIDGVVISREVDEGQTVAASLQAPRLFIIAQDLREMQIDTAIDEADIGQVLEGQRVSFTVDAYRNKTFTGIVEQVRLSPIEASNVITYSVMVNVKNDALLLKPGMTANVDIIAADKKDVLRIPTQALYFKPTGRLARQLAQIADNLATDTLPIWVDSEKPELRKLKIGVSNNDFIEVLDGNLKDGEAVIIGGAGNNGGKNRQGTGLDGRSMRRATRRL
jgi:HlyD family secretion protein